MFKKIFFLIALSVSFTFNSNASQAKPNEAAPKKESKGTAESGQLTIQDEIQQINRLWESNQGKGSEKFFQVFSDLIKKLNQFVPKINLDLHNPSQMNDMMNQIDHIYQILVNFGQRVTFELTQRMELTCLHGNMKSFFIRFATRMNSHRLLIPFYYELIRNWESIISIGKQLSLLESTVTLDMNVTEEFYPYFQLRYALERVEDSIECLKDINSSNNIDGQTILAAENKAYEVAVEAKKIIEEHAKIIIELQAENVKIIDKLKFVKRVLIEQINICAQKLKIIDVPAVPALSVAALSVAESKRDAEVEPVCPPTPRGSNGSSRSEPKDNALQVPQKAEKKPSHTKVDSKEKAEERGNLLSKSESYSSQFVQDCTNKDLNEQARQDIQKGLDITGEFLRIVAENNLEKVDGFQNILCRHDWANTDKALRAYDTKKIKLDIQNAWKYSRKLLKDAQEFADHIVASLKFRPHKSIENIPDLIAKFEDYSKQFVQNALNKFADAQQAS